MSSAKPSCLIRSRINLARFVFSRLQSFLCSRHEISVRTKGRAYQAVVCSVLLYGCETWLVRVADERMLEVFANDSIRCILCVRCRNCVPSAELRCRLCLTSIPALLMQRRRRWFGLPTPPRTWRRRTGDQLKAWATTLKVDLEPLYEPRVFGHAR